MSGFFYTESIFKEHLNLRCKKIKEPKSGKMIKRIFLFMQLSSKCWLYTVYKVLGYKAVKINIL